MRVTTHILRFSSARLATPCRQPKSIFYQNPSPLRLCSGTSRRNFSIYARVCQASSTGEIGVQDNESFFRYEDGRWLWDEEQQLRNRYRAFNADELKRIAAEALGSQKCVGMFKHHEDEFGKIFRLEMDDGTFAIAKIPHLNTDDLRQMISSEVATMDFARTTLGFPVPEVIAWDARPDNPAQVEYIIMEEPDGHPLDEQIFEMSPESLIDITEQIVGFEKGLLQAEFNKYGSLYYTSDDIAGTEQFELVKGAAEFDSEHIRQRFVLGPEPFAFSRGGRSRLRIDRGPWTSVSDFLHAIGKREIAWINRYGLSKFQPRHLLIQDSYDRQEHIDNLNKGLDSIANRLPESQFAKPHLWHNNLAAPFLWVHEDRITGIIGWHTAAVGPLFLNYLEPLLISYYGDKLLSLPQNFDQLDETEQQEIKEKYINSIMLQAYQEGTKEQNPIIADIQNDIKSSALRYLADCMSNTWEESIIPLKEELVFVQKNATEPLPYEFNEEEMENIENQASAFQSQEEYWQEISSAVSQSGEISPPLYPAVVAALKELRREWLILSSRGEEREAVGSLTSWIDDLPEEDEEEEE